MKHTNIYTYYYARDRFPHSPCIIFGMKEDKFYFKIFNGFFPFIFL